jgi:large subunit ribosomal protein L35
MAKSYKLKTHSGAKKRFKLTKTGKLKYKRTNRNHLFTEKATKRKRQNRVAGYCVKADAAQVKALLPYK